MQEKRIVLDLLCRVILRNEDHFDLKVAQQGGVSIAAKYILEESGAQAGKALFVAIEFGLDSFKLRFDDFLRSNRMCVVIEKCRHPAQRMDRLRQPRKRRTHPAATVLFREKLGHGVDRLVAVQNDQASLVTTLVADRKSVV